ncbi:glycosyl hydrolase [Actinophytocola sp.]|uniref:glycosyl hydrolase n=1 Tax=Actinophytocola sp. TaxID=1872138 RepID=UPI0038999CEF
METNGFGPVRSPVTPDASTATRELLDLLYRVSGRRLLSGQHNQPAHGSGWTEKITALTGRTPVVWGLELGFSPPGTLDAVDRRDANLAEAIAWHRRGAVIAVTWHAVCPVDDEPVAFEGGVLRDDFTAEQYEVLTPGSRLHQRWAAQVDVAAGLLRRLADAGVPVLWRPYHEMNGPWFWWGGQPERLTRLWRLLFDRLTVHHRLTNLVWVWNPNSAYGGTPPVSPFYPGGDVVDVLATDTYGGHYEPEHYEVLLRLADGRPIGLGECGALPPDETLTAQPRWCWFMAWPTQVTAENTVERIREFYAHPRVVTLESPDLRSI